MIATHDKTLEQFITATDFDQPTQDQVEQAQSRLNRVITKVGSGRRHSAGWRPRLAFGGLSAAAVMIVVLISLPLQTSIAFSDVQRFFLEYTTLKSKVTMHTFGMQVWSMEVVSDQEGNTRIDMDRDQGTSFIVNTSESVMLVLDHDRKTVNRLDLEIGVTPEAVENLHWLQRIREYQGQATQLAETREINGLEAMGFEWFEDRYRITVWADQANGLPLQVIVTAKDGLFKVQADLSFDDWIDPILFDAQPPDGYQEVSNL